MQADPPKRKRRWLQFSLRSLLVAVTFMAAACGYVAREVAITKERREAAETYEPLRELFVMKSRSGADKYVSKNKHKQAPCRPNAAAGDSRALGDERSRPQQSLAQFAMFDAQ